MTEVSTTVAEYRRRAQRLLRKREEADKYQLQTLWSNVLNKRALLPDYMEAGDKETYDLDKEVRRVCHGTGAKRKINGVRWSTFDNTSKKIDAAYAAN